ncbi:MAG: hypothetical protein QXK89_01125 [Candidatus Bathyarchaeia archaeon]
MDKCQIIEMLKTVSVIEATPYSNTVKENACLILVNFPQIYVNSKR